MHSLFALILRLPSPLVTWHTQVLSAKISLIFLIATEFFDGRAVSSLLFQAMVAYRKPAEPAPAPQEAPAAATSTDEPGTSGAANDEVNLVTCFFAVLLRGLGLLPELGFYLVCLLLKLALCSLWI